MAVKSKPEEPSRMRVIKTLRPDSRGAVKLHRQFGDALICVRHRTDDKAQCRHTTVELLVESTPIRPRAEHMVAVAIRHDEKSLQAVVRMAGGKWDPVKRVWRLPKRVVGILKLTNRTVKT